MNSACAFSQMRSEAASSALFADACESEVASVAGRFQVGWRIVRGRMRVRGRFEGERTAMYEQARPSPSNYTRISGALAISSSAIREMEFPPSHAPSEHGEPIAHIHELEQPRRRRHKRQLGPSVYAVGQAS